MNKSEIAIGVDVGNNDTKGSSSTIPTGFDISRFKPSMVADEDFIKYGDNYYSFATTDRFPYTKDKTVDDAMFILTLMTIAKEIITKCDNGFELSTEELQEKVSKIKTVHLGIGLPPTHMGKFKDAYVNYYREKGKDGVKFTYRDVNFDFKFGEIRAYVQNFATIMTYMPPEDSVLRQFETYRVIDIGGYTVDKIDIVNKKPDVSNSYSRELGVNRFIEMAIPAIDKETGNTLSKDTIEAVLTNKATTLDEETKEYVKRLAEEWAENIVKNIKSGEDLKAFPTIFMGGGSMLFHDYLIKCPELGTTEFLTGTHRNAEAYRKLITAEVRKKEEAVE